MTTIIMDLAKNVKNFFLIRYKKSPQNLHPEDFVLNEVKELPPTVSFVRVSQEDPVTLP